MPGLARTLVLVFAALCLSGCLSTRGTGQAAAPSIAQGALGSELVGMGLGGSAQQAALKAEYQALQFGAVGQPVPWQDGAFAGQVVPTQLYRVGSQDCRGYTHTVTRQGRTVQQVGSACRTGDVWTPVA
ncbi:hypothetical protein IGS74_15730 [Aureimonas sp. OT7]|uniref:hypothetical protein n=1 Tax=Aureimonas TaxID=414371 RepID=UPI00177CA5E9|nr:MULTISPECIES: hypothetical protein [Aureimonas]QOG05993.1 hypothetical protein IGS74_15730 [Aureimonas sp. OT7]